MKRRMALFLSLIMICSLFIFFSSNAQVNAFPSQEITLIVTYGPGGGADRLARAFVSVAPNYFPVPLRVINIAGAGGARGVLDALAAETDGHTLIFTSAAAIIGPPLFEDVGYIPHEDLVGIARTGVFDFGIVTKRDAPWETFNDFVQDALENPGAYTYGSAGVGGSTHFGMELLMEELGIEVIHVPFPGSGESILAAAGGHIDITFTTSSSMIPPVQSGEVKGLVVTSEERLNGLPDVPTVMESGYDFSWSFYRGIWGSSDIPEDRVLWLSEKVKEVLEDPSFISLARALGEPAAYLDSYAISNWTEHTFTNLAPMAERFK